MPRNIKLGRTGRAIFQTAQVLERLHYASLTPAQASVRMRIRHALTERIDVKTITHAQLIYLPLGILTPELVFDALAGKKLVTS